MPALSEVVVAKARAAGADDWLDELDGIVSTLSERWSLDVGATFDGATEAYVAAATTRDGEQCVLKVLVPRGDGAARNEATALRLADGEGCPRLLRCDLDAGALLIERLGPSLHELGLPIEQRHEILCDAASRVWRRVERSGLPTGTDKAHWLIEWISSGYESLGRPCAPRTVAHAVACAKRRAAAHDEATAVLVHGDVHQWNALRAPRGFKLVDPDGLVADPAYDLGVLMREDPLELLESGPMARAEMLAERTGCDVTAIWEWGVVERVSTGLVCTQVGLQPLGREMLGAADALSA